MLLNDRVVMVDYHFTVCAFNPVANIDVAFKNGNALCRLKLHTVGFSLDCARGVWPCPLKVNGRAFDGDQLYFIVLAMVHNHAITKKVIVAIMTIDITCIFNAMQWLVIAHVLGRKV